MEVAIPSNPIDFDFNSSVYASAPTTPRIMSDSYFSVPTSPTRIGEVNPDEFDDLIISDETHRNSLATVPFAWEEKPGVPKSFSSLCDADFAFDVSGEFHRDSSVTADDLFHAGVIKLMEPKPPPTAAVQKRERGRERGSGSGSGSASYGRLPSSRSRRTRSLPPVRGFEQPPPAAVAATRPPPSTCTTLSASGSGKGSKKWSFKDLFLFRSASDGRAMDRDPLKKYSGIFRKHDEDFRISSMRSDRSVPGTGSMRRGRVSAHELHYAVNRAVSNDMKKKTFLPYKQGILGRLAFNPTVHALANGFGFSNKN